MTNNQNPEENERQGSIKGIYTYIPAKSTYDLLISVPWRPKVLGDWDS